MHSQLECITYMRRIKPAISALWYNILLQARRSTRNICNAAVCHSLIAHYLLDVPAEFCRFAALAYKVYKNACARVADGQIAGAISAGPLRASFGSQSWSAAMCPLHKHRNVGQRDHETCSIPRKNTWLCNPIHFINTQNSGKISHSHLYF